MDVDTEDNGGTYCNRVEGRCIEAKRVGLGVLGPHYTVDSKHTGQIWCMKRDSLTLSVRPGMSWGRGGRWQGETLCHGWETETQVILVSEDVGLEVRVVDGSYWEAVRFWGEGRG